jgi:ribosomal-protein-serine acetyltransferase
VKEISLPPRLEADRICLKRNSPENASELFAAIDDDRARLAEFLPWIELTRTIDDQASYLRMTNERWESFQLFDYGIYRKSDSRYLGGCGVHTISWQNGRCELGYWILRDFEGQGFVAEAVRMLEKALFDLGFNRLEIHCSSSNVRSAKIPRACGFSLEGTLRQDELIDGRYYDTYVFAKLKSD